jgi:hypothetical protein
MPGSLRDLRHELTGRLRNGATHLITGMPEDRRAELAERVRAGRASRALLRRASGWYGRAPWRTCSTSRRRTCRSTTRTPA